MTITITDRPAVYPRVCGGTADKTGHRPDELGLSPRVRGNLPFQPGVGPRPRSIPACAGEPPYRSRPSQLRRVYPRVCGGTGGTDPDTWMYRGLSPRVRGNHDRAGKR